MSHDRVGRRAALRAAVAVSALAGLAAAWAAPAALAAAPRPAAPGSSAPDAPDAPAAGGTDWLHVANGRLVYGHDAQGNRIPDFSYAGYRNGAQPLPTAKVAVTLDPAPSGDDADRIQQALDKVAAMPVGPDGLRGAVMLSAGTFRVGKALRIKASGVVLRGAGSGSGGTKLVASGEPRPLVELAGEGAPQKNGAEHAVTDDYVPVGATTLTLDSAAGLKAGQQIVVQRPQEDAWIKAVGMDSIPPRPDGTPSKPWTPNDGLQFQRTVTAVDGNRVTLDIPLTNALEKQYTHAKVWAYDFPGRISQVGVEGFSADGSAFTSAPGYDEHGYFASRFVDFAAVQDAWARDIAADRFGAGVGSIGATASRVTVADTSATGMEHAVPQRAPFAQPGAYSIDGQQSLVVNCKVSGSNVHAWLTGARVAGPNVFSHCTSDNTGGFRLDAGPHQRWATGTLYDDITMLHSRGPSDDLALTNRANAGSGQGWAGANQVMWNADVGYYGVENPPTAHNWAFGTRGTPVEGRQTGVLVSTGTPVQPESLYAQQLAERGGAAPAPAPDPAPTSGPATAPPGTPAPKPSTTAKATAPAAVGPAPAASPTGTATATGSATAAPSGTHSSAAAAGAGPSGSSLAATGSEGLSTMLTVAGGTMIAGGVALGLARERRRGRHSG
ncbi:hypothetical protein ACFV4F_07675 [Kitasatospora sp. NPDC059722]|uniref:hypothetical protein n=1 Tax=Kitasatospora sp. NPDC059722 TaxID=3346925 RepID=UPI00369BB773